MWSFLKGLISDTESKFPKCRINSSPLRKGDSQFSRQVRRLEGAFREKFPPAPGGCGQKIPPRGIKAVSGEMWIFPASRGTGILKSGKCQGRTAVERRKADSWHGNC